MKIVYQWVPGAYSNLASLQAKEILNCEVTQELWLPDFKSVWEAIDENTIWVIPVENSYAGNIHENLYNFLRYDFKIIGKINLEVNHCLLSNEENIGNITHVYSHPQALSQCHDYLKSKNIDPIVFGDTAWAAAMLQEKQKPGAAAIASSLAAEIYRLNNLDEAIQDQNGNTTRFFIVVPRDSQLQCAEDRNKTSIIFESRNIPAALYKCLGAFATNNVNLTKIESLPSLKDPFTYLFWLDFEGHLELQNVQKSLEELKFFTNSIKILWEY